MTNLVTTEAPRSLALADDELIPVLRSSLYPGAKDESIKLVVSYCRAANLDPLQKPVHIVPMSVKNPGPGNDYEWRDVVMPGIGLYRVQAARTGELAGIDEPEFGDTIKVGGIDVPEWCRVTVYRMIGGQRVAFTAREYWIENYATAGRNSSSPNAMWTKRPRGQLAKCAEAQALRKAFPELGSQPTADETIIDAGEVIDNGAPVPTQPEGFKVTRKPRAQAQASNKPADVTDVTPKGEADDHKTEPAGVITPQPPAQEAARKADEVRATYGNKEAENFEPNQPLIGAGEVAYLKNKAKAVGADLEAVLAEMGGLVLDRLTKADFAAVKSKLMSLE